MNILVTGGIGYVGSCLLSMLKEDEFSRTNIIRSLDKNRNLKFAEVKRELETDERYQLIVGDITRNKDVEKSLDNIDTIVHLAAISGLEECMKDPSNAILTNIYGTQKVLELAVKSNVERVVFASSAAVYGNPGKEPIVEERRLKPLNLYGITKAAGEQLIEAYHENYGLCTTILRLANVYGLGIYTLWNTVTTRFIKLAIEEKPLEIYGSGEQARNFVHVRDVVSVIISCLKAKEESIKGEIFNIGGRKSISINEHAGQILRLVKKKSGKSTSIIHTPPRLGETYTPYFQYSIKKAEERLRYNPRVGPEEGITELIHYIENLSQSNINSLDCF